ncbi:MAG: hypothetical protein IKW00_04660 [Clostridia bacterium]|nr:hypothetical protein [Clostridia bacterium]
MKKLLIIALALLCITSAAMAAETTYTGVCDPITVNTAGEHTVILDGVFIDDLDTTAIGIKAPATKLTIILKNNTHSILYAAPESAAIENNGQTIVIRCESADNANHECDDNCGSLYAYGRSGGAGIGSGYCTDMTGSVIIEGGNLEIAASYNGAGIGSGELAHMVGSVTINGGNLTVNGGNSAAGIGGGARGDLNGSVTVNGGNLYIKSGWDGAGIGGGAGSDLTGRVVINGGNVRASAGHWEGEGGTYDNGSGIGGGASGDLTGHVVINGGKVTADSRADVSAGIGGYNMAGNILIAGGEVIALGFDNCAAIGGVNSTSGKITVSGGKVYAVVSEGNRIVGIGSAWEDMSGTITITGGELFACAPGFNALGVGDGSEITGKIIVDPAVGMIKSEIGDCDYVYADEVVHYQASNVAPLEGSPYAARKDITHLLKNKSFAHFWVVIPEVTPDLPVTGDPVNVALFALLAGISLMSAAVILLSKRRA